MDRPVLYSSRSCPFSIRARLALVRAGIQCELREIDLRDKPSQLAQLSADSTVPVLVPPRAPVLDDSLAIMHWALDGRPELALWPDSRVMQQAVENLVATAGGPFATAVFRYRYSERFPRDRLEYRQDAEVFLAQLEARLARSGWLVGPRETLADLAILPFVSGFARIEPDWFAKSPYVALGDWLGFYTESELFSIAMRKHPVWIEGGAPVWLLPTLGSRAVAS